MSAPTSIIECYSNKTFTGIAKIIQYFTNVGAHPTFCKRGGWGSIQKGGVVVIDPNKTCTTFQSKKKGGTGSGPDMCVNA